MPATSIRDLVVHEDDLVVGTHGRSFWILDDVTALRQIDQRVASSDAFLFKPEAAYRIRRSVNTDTPIPPEAMRGRRGDVVQFQRYCASNGAFEVQPALLVGTGLSDT